ncbi:DMT family transporter [Venatoribacter cucullus]|uniref:DMT family transporter n=1 Tax=Venatoribacter cucullus TaxID=2661630 RepID=UPI001938908C|nr:DMT family transporter [Venatoribacter cucullus]QQD22316.1 EamA family transporter [Oceanospirillaceae bacterium ASx5O]UZK04334.1 EamA family transporter [Venatoribacter cucullus]
MALLWAITLLWAFSFSLIGVYLAGQVDSYFAVLTRVVLAALVFLPLLLRNPLAPKLALQLMGIGAIQLGLMYLFYYQSFLLLSVPEVLIFTIFTPVYVTLIYDLLERRFHPRYLVSAVLAIGGAAIMRWNNLNEDFWQGFLVVQGANLCFAAGQVLYKYRLEYWPQAQQPAQHKIFGWFYLGALAVVLPAWWLLGQPAYPTSNLQWSVLIWLGVVASGLGYFAWNLGATQVSSGQLAIMNNALIPAGLLVNLLLWNRDTDLLRLSAGAVIMLLALWLTRAWPPR